jgi:hypothetical protein
MPQRSAAREGENRTVNARAIFIDLDPKIALRGNKILKPHPARASSTTKSNSSLSDAELKTLNASIAPFGIFFCQVRQSITSHARRGSLQRSLEASPPRMLISCSSSLELASEYRDHFSELNNRLNFTPQHDL